MEKNSPEYVSEINLNELFQVIWKRKAAIILIALFSTLVIATYNHNNQKPDKFGISLNISPSKLVDYNELSFLNSALGMKVDPNFFIKKLKKELEDYQEVISVLKKIDSVKEKISQLSENEQERKLNKYAKLFTIDTEIDKLSLEPSGNYIFKFNWNDIEESKEILDKVMKLAIKNLKKEVFKNMLHKIEVDRRINNRNDKITINILQEQSSIAKSLNLLDGKLDFGTSQNIVIDYSGGNAYYLRGYKAIDKEINLIQNRQYQHLSDLKKEIIKVKNNNTINNWVDYNIGLIRVESFQKYNLKTNLITSGIYGLIIGFFYVFISNFYRSRIVTKD
mgnify:CR=1 FL=1|tara:strand:+ start:2922 stop:3926 length:1005 start_codon:yes stop_codon:yes gene_type:complete